MDGNIKVPNFNLFDVLTDGVSRLIQPLFRHDETIVKEYEKNNIIPRINTFGQTNGSINDSASIEPKPMNYSDFPYNGFNGDSVVNGYTNHNGYYGGSPTFGDGNIKIEPIKLEMSGKLELTNNGQTIDIIKELENNPLIIRAITKMISEGISQKINGGRAIYNGGNLVSF